MASEAFAPERVVLMRYGFHGQEGVSIIVRRKRGELRSAGVMLWGYGGTLCDPRRQVRPMCAEGEACLALTPTSSPFRSDGSEAREMSVDRECWESLPRGIRVTSSTKALVCGTFEPMQARMDLSQYVVAQGKSAGRKATDYLRFRVDKACLVRRLDPGAEPRWVPIDWRLGLAPPFAVYVR